jgi:hypothetical protein
LLLRIRVASAGGGAFTYDNFFFCKEYQLKRVRMDTLAFFRRDFTVKPSVTKGPAWRNRAFVSRRGDVAVAIICC